MTSDVEPASATMRRLLERQYINTVVMMFGRNAAFAASPPSDTALNGYQSIAASQLAMNDTLGSDYQTSAQKEAAAAVGKRERIDELIDCNAEDEGQRTCFERYLTRVGRLAFRRPLDTEEVEEYVAVGELAVDTLGDFYHGIEHMTAALLQSPSFLFQVEIGDPLEGSDGVRKLNGFEMASRMSLFLLDRGPDERLLDAAAAGELDTEEGVRTWAIELLRLPEARDASAAFFTEYFVLGDLHILPKDPAMFPEYSGSFARDMREETMQLIADIVWDRNAPATELLTADYTFVNEPLADLYGVAGPHNAEWTKTSLPIEQNRSGVLSHASVLSKQAHTNGTSATYRGIFILERFLCSSMPPPPEGVVAELPPSSTAPTMRERIAVHQEDPVCAGCHLTVDSMGLALENFDAIGRWRAEENGVIIDATGEHGLIGAFDGVRGLSEALVDSEEATHCMVRNLYRHATGHVEEQPELRSLDELHVRFAESGYSWRTLLADMVSSPLMRAVGPMEAAQ